MRHDLSNGIIQLLEDEALRNVMSQRCRAIALKEYPLELQVQRYLELYRHVLAHARHDVSGSAALDKQSKSISMDAGVSQVGRVP